MTTINTSFDTEEATLRARLAELQRAANAADEAFAAAAATASPDDPRMAALFSAPAVLRAQMSVIERLLDPETLARRRAAAAAQAAEYDKAGVARRALPAKARKLLQEQADILKSLFANIEALRILQDHDAALAEAQQAANAAGRLGRSVPSRLVGLGAVLPDPARLEADYRSSYISLDNAELERK